MASLARNLFERRVPHVLVIYAGGSFALVEFTAFMVDEFLLSPHWTRVVLTAVLLLLPSAAMLAWFHGRQGRDKVPLTEKIGIPANLAVAATVLLLLFGGEDLGAATTAVSVETEDGETVERVVPKPEFRKRTALFPFDAGPGLIEEEAWLTYMAPLVLELDLAADDFFEPLLFGAFMQRLAELGFPALRDVPLSLKREVAAEFHSAFIVGGTIESVEDRYRLTLTLHDAASGSQVSETVHEGLDFLALIDEMSEALADALEIPDRDDVEDLAVRERLTENDAAWEAFGQIYPRLLTNPPDLDAAVAGLSAATALDPTFTIAQYQLAVLLLSVNRPGEAVAPIQAAIDHLYRLPERLRFRVRSDYYFLMQQPEKAWAGPVGVRGGAGFVSRAGAEDRRPGGSAGVLQIPRTDVRSDRDSGRPARRGSCVADADAGRPGPVLRHRPVSGRGPVRRRRGPVRGTAVSASTARERLPGPQWEIHIALGAEDGDAARGAYHAAFDAMEATELGVLRPELTGDLGRIDELDGNYDAAVANYRDAMAQDPGRNFHRRTGRALRKAGRLDEAEAELREALRLRPADPRAHLEMARVLEARGDTSGAAEHLRSALAAWEPADESFGPVAEARDLLADLSG